MIDPHDAEREIDEAYLAETRHQLDQRMRQYVVDWASRQNDRLLIAAYSAVNGHWDNVRNDLRRKRIDFVSAHKLIDVMRRYGLISDFLHRSLSDQFTKIHCGVE